MRQTCARAGGAGGQPRRLPQKPSEMWKRFGQAVEAGLAATLPAEGAEGDTPGWDTMRRNIERAANAVSSASTAAGVTPSVRQRLVADQRTRSPL